MKATEYKEEIREIIDDLENERILEMIYGFVKRMYEIEKEERRKQVAGLLFHFANFSINCHHSFLSASDSS